MTETKQEAATATKKTSHYRWVITGLIFFITIVNYLDRSAISYAIGPLKREFGLTDQDFGFIGSAFGIGYAVMTIGGGLLVDAFGSRKIWSLAAILWSTVTALLGTANGFVTLFAFRTLLGLAEGPHFPALTRAITDWLPRDERARSTALGLAAVPFASVIGAPLISHLILTVGWKAMFGILGTLGLGWAGIWYIMFRDYPENSAFVNDEELKHIREGRVITRGQSDHELRQTDLAEGKTTWRYMLLNPALMTNNYAFFAFGYLLFFAMTWLPGYLEATYGLGLKQVGIFLIAPWLTAAVLLAIAGFLSDYLWKKTHSIRIARSHMIWICQLISGLCFLPVIFVHSLPVAITFISLGVGIGLMPNAAFYALNSDLAKDRAATSLGIMDFFFAASGILAPGLTGVLATATGGFGAALGLLVFFTLTSVAGVFFFQHPDREIVS
jgi:ACS family hexuronate transporter-like MFS transporter